MCEEELSAVPNGSIDRLEAADFLGGSLQGRAGASPPVLLSEVPCHRWKSSAAVKAAGLAVNAPVQGCGSSAWLLD